MKVYSQQNLLHHIQEMEFIDSPEFESSVTGEEKFQVFKYSNGNFYLPLIHILNYCKLCKHNAHMQLYLFSFSFPGVGEQEVIFMNITEWY